MVHDVQGDTTQSSTEEYGFPSTHSVNAICFSGYLVHYFNKAGAFAGDSYLQPDWWPQSWLPPLVLTSLALWCCNICYGRIYLGMHTPVDIIGGVILGWAILFFWIIVEDFCDAWITAGFMLLPLYQLVYSMVILYAYPVPERRNPSFSYSLYLTAACNGVVLGVWRTYPTIHSSAWAVTTKAARGALLSYGGFTFVGLRFIVGIPIVLLARQIGKSLALLVMPPFVKLLGLNARLEGPDGASSIPIGVSNLSNAVRFVAYTLVGWATTDWCFIAFDWLGI